MSQKPSMTCREFVDFLVDYQSHELPEPTLRTFERHLSACANCVRYLETYQATVALSRLAFVMPGKDVPADVPEELVQAILAAQRNS
jgi:anti-sigma factor RsiW